MTIPNFIRNSKLTIYSRSLLLTRPEYLLTYVVGFAVLICILVTYRWSSNLWGEEGFSEYAIGRRLLAFILSIATLGMEIAIPRHVAFADRRLASNAYFLGGLLPVCLAVIALSVPMVVFPDWFAMVFFGNSNYDYLMPSLTILLIGSVANVLCYGYLRGLLKIYAANAVKLINMAVIPLLAFALFSSALSSVWSAMGWAMFLVSSSTLLAVVRLPKEKADIMAHTKKMLNYGLQRVPGQLLIMALLTLPITFAAHATGVKMAGYVAFGITLINMVGSSFAMAGVVMLPELSRMLGRVELRDFERFVSSQIVPLITVCILIVFVLQIFVHQILAIFVGQYECKAVYLLRLVILGALPYSFYMWFRNVIDAMYKQAKNTLNALIAFFIFVVGSFLIKATNDSTIYLGILFVVGLYVLGYLTFYEVQRIIARLRL